MKRLATITLSIILVLVVASPMASGQSSDTSQSTTSAAAPNRPTDSQHITVMTRNLYLGANLDQAILAILSGNQQVITDAATVTWASVVATNFPERAEVLADEIFDDPIVSLGSLTGLRSGSPHPRFP